MTNTSTSALLNIHVFSFLQLVDDLKFSTHQISNLFDLLQESSYNSICLCHIETNANNKDDFSFEYWTLFEHIRNNYNMTGEVIIILDR